MKNTIYLILLLFAGIANATNIPNLGAAFKAKLLQSSTTNNIAKDMNDMSIQIDANNDNKISVAEASAVFKLYIDSSSIDDLSGIENFVNLTTLDFHQNTVSVVDLSSLVNLQTVNAKQNNLSTIDVSALSNLSILYIGGNVLQTIYAKNGNGSGSLDFSGGGNNGLSYICIDESQITQTINDSNGLNPIVNSYCTPTPDGSYTTLSGSIVFDGDSNGIDAADAKFPFVKVQCQIGTQILQTTSDINGQYAFYTQQTSGTYTVTPGVEDSSIFVVPASIGGMLGVNATHDFPITPLTVIAPDLEVVVAPISSAVPNMNADYQVTYKNKGSKSVNGNVLLSYDSSKASIVTCTDSNASIAIPGQVSLNYSNLLPFETRSFTVTIALNSGNAIGDILNFDTSITDNLGPTETTTAADNMFTYKQTVGAVNHNTINCLEGNNLDTTEIGKYLHYAVNFENTGTATANNVVLKMVFDTTQYDMNSLQILNSSHPLNLKVDGGKAMFYLTNVDIGGPGGDGGILLKIKSDTGLAAGSTVISSAEIFFDYGTNFNSTVVANSVVTTNLASTTYQNLSVSQNQLDATVVVYPNPTSSILKIDSNNSIKIVQLFDISGRLLQTNLYDSDKVSIDLAQRTAGIYFLKITSDKGQKVEKIEKD